MEENNRRYFVVYFTGQSLMQNKNTKEVEKITRRGKIHMFVENMGYVNEKFIHAKIEEDFKMSEPYIERVEELSEEDFYDFIAEDYPYPIDDNPKRKGKDYEDLL